MIPGREGGHIFPSSRYFIHFNLGIYKTKFIYKSNVPDYIHCRVFSISYVILCHVMIIQIEFSSDYQLM